MGKRSYHHGNLREALLEEASRMIAEHGVGGVTMRALGERLSVSRAAPYRHFADKEALLVAVAEAGFRRLGERLARVDAAADGAGIARVRRLGEEYVRFALDNPAHYRLMYGKEALTRDDQPELRAAADALFEQLVAVFRAHQRVGALKRQRPDSQAYVAWSAVHGLALLILEGQIRPDDVDGVIRQATGTILEGMRRQG